MEVYSIGFTQKTASEFFGALRRAGVRRLLDVRLSNSSQLAGFTKRDDLPFFLRELCGAEYRHELLLAPTEQLLREYQKKQIRWSEYEAAFLHLLAERRVETEISRDTFAIPTVLLCSEVKPDRCHRRLVLEYLKAKWDGDFIITHL